MWNVEGARRGPKPKWSFQYATDIPPMPVPSRLIPSQKRGKYYLIEESDMKKRKTGKGRKC